MLGYLKKFNNLPAELRKQVSSPEAMAAIEKLEKKYQLPLASFIMKVMVKEIGLADLASFLLMEYLTKIAVEQLVKELNEKIFFSLEDYFLSPVLPPDLAGSTGIAGEAGALTKRAGRSGQNLTPLSQASAASESGASAVMIRPSDQSSVKSDSFFFSPDDEQEIRELTEKIILAEKIKLSSAKIEANLEAIVNRAQINFGSADLADRFKQILKTYLRGIRNKLETELALTKPFLSGGLSFDEDSAWKVMVMADKIVHPVKSQSEIGTQSVFNGVNSVKSGSAVIPSDGQADETVKLSAKIRIQKLDKSQEEGLAVARDAPYDFSKLVQAGKASVFIPPSATRAGKKATSADKEILADKSLQRIDQPRVHEPKPELAPLTLARSADAPARQAATAAQGGKPPPIRTEAKASASSPETGSASPMPLIRRRLEAENLSRNQKIKVEDVKYIPRVMSPLAEIKYLDLVNFRRLDQDPQKAIDKIKSKINLLEEEGYGKRLEGIKFWRSSPLNRLYLAIGHLSISRNKPVDVIIEERKIKASDYLTVAEFKAIMDLNKSLRF